jgi:hypothetical protein
MTQVSSPKSRAVTKIVFKQQSFFDDNDVKEEKTGSDAQLLQ